MDKFSPFSFCYYLPNISHWKKLTVLNPYIIMTVFSVNRYFYTYTHIYFNSHFLLSFIFESKKDSYILDYHYHHTIIRLGEFYPL